MGAAGSSPSASTEGLPGYGTAKYGGNDPANGAVCGSFFDHSQGPLQGVLVVRTRGVVENFNPGTGDRRLRLWLGGSHVSCCDFSAFTSSGASVVVVGTYDGQVALINATDLTIIRIITAAGGADEEVELWSREGRREEEVEDGERARSGSEDSLRRKDRVCAVRFVDEDCVCWGTSSGEALLYRLSRGEVIMKYTRTSSPLYQEEEEEKGGHEGGGRRKVRSRCGTPQIEACAVTGITACTIQLEGAGSSRRGPGVAVIVVGYHDGLCQAFERSTGKCVRSLAGAPGLKSVHYMSSINSAVLSYTKKNELWLWDVERDDTQILDFEEELKSLRQPISSFITALCVDSPRNLLIVGCDDARLYVRKIVRHSQTEEGAGPGSQPSSSYYYSVQLVRLGCPAKGTEYSISSLFYEGIGDSLFIGDVSGALKVVKEAAASSTGGR